ncbi:hypothetical protein ACFP56_12185 [Paenibacillus septentrionalis]|uniref:Uncharacterized protein n=1 Tax=Paenibacillus septentrionalis TaxID=429342 RepID=A0ABW1V5Z4_9BACL
MAVNNNDILLECEGRTVREDYTFANLEDKPELLKELQNLEEKIEQQLGVSVNLIAYTPDKEQLEIYEELDSQG